MNNSELTIKSFVKVKLNGEYGQITEIEIDHPPRRGYHVRLYKSLRIFWFKDFELEKIDYIPGKS